MNRVIAVTAAFATAAMAGTMAVSIVPAMAAPRPAAAHLTAHGNTGHSNAGHSAKTGTTAKTNAQIVMAAPAKAAAVPGASLPPTVIGSEFAGGKYVTVVQCQGVDSPPPITLARPAKPLIVNGAGPSAAILKTLQRPNSYKTIYTCTVTVKEKAPAKPKAALHKAHKPGCEIAAGGPASSARGRASSRCTKPVTLNTGFGGLAPQVKNHHPAG
jgi:hypothetical protein